MMTAHEHRRWHSKNFTSYTRKKISESMIGIKRSDETKKKMSLAKRNMSDETKKKMSLAKKGIGSWNYGSSTHNEGEIWLKKDGSYITRINGKNIYILKKEWIKYGLL